MSDLARPEDPAAQLQRLRASIDNLDAALVHLLAERFRCTQEVGELKARAGMPPADPGREAYQIARLRALADESGLDPTFAEQFLALVIDEVIRNHESINRSRAEAGATGGAAGGATAAAAQPADPPRMPR